MADWLSDLGIGITNALGWTKKVDPTPAPSNPVLKPIAPLAAPKLPSIATSFAGQDQIEALNRQTAAIQAQIAAQPKLIYRDTNAAWQNAQNTAASSVNPVYQDNLNRFLTGQAAALSQQQAETQAQKDAQDAALTQTTEDIATNRTRTAQDTASAIAQNLTNENNWQTTEGTDASVAEDASRVALGDQGIEGRGAGSLEQAKITRNLASKVQTDNFANDRDTKTLLASRTFQDLDTEGSRATTLNSTAKANLDRTLNDFITNQGNDLENEKASNEASRLAALFQATQQQYTTDTASWLAQLAKSGTRSQDLALATSVYGGR